MKIKRFNQFESISGWELVGQHVMGPGYPEQELAVTLSTSDTEVLMAFDGNMYTYDDYQSLYQDYLKKGGNPLQGFSKENLNTVIKKISNNLF
jgi:hypothetical protein